VHPTNVLGLRWDKTEVDPQVAARLEPQVRDLEIVRALWRHEVLLLSHLWQEWWPDRATRAAQLRLVRSTRAQAAEAWSIVNADDERRDQAGPQGHGTGSTTAAVP